MKLRDKKILFSIQNHFLLKDDVKNNMLNVLKEETKESLIISDKFRNKYKRRFYKLFNSISKRLKIKSFERLYIKCKEKAQLNELKKYGGADYILFISGENYSKRFLKLLRKANPKAKIILFLYDKLKYSLFKAKIDCFDFVFSFDR